MGNRLAGKKILVTAAAQGMGKAIAVGCAAEGATVIATDVNEKVLAELDGAAGITTRRLDVLNDADVRAAAAEIGALNGLMNIAGFVHHGTVLECDDETWDFAFNLNVKSMLRTCRAFLPAMIEAGGGSIVNMASVASTIRGIPFRLAYGASKAAVMGLTKSIAADFVGQGVRCNALAPGTIESPSLEDRINAFDDPVEARKNFIARQPMGRLGRPEEVAHMAIHLVSDESAFTTGQVIAIDGGIST